MKPDNILADYYGPIVEQLSLFTPEAKNILIASAVPAEGRSTSAIGLAFTTALLKPDKRVLLVDLDLQEGVEL